MPALPLLLIIEIICIIHVLKTNRDRIWFLVIFGLPGIGVILYFFMEVLPELRQSRSAKIAAKKLAKTLDPHIDLKQLAKNLRVSNNVENKVKLAQECMNVGLYEEATELYKSCLTGVYATDPSIMEALAHSRFAQEEYNASRQILDELIQANPTYQSQSGHLLYARALEASGEQEKALEEYRVLADYYNGAEAKCRYALLLRKNGQTEQARRLFQELLDHAETAPKFYLKTQREWLDIARENLKY